MFETLLLLLVFTGSIIQRVAGLGFAMFASPFLVLIIGAEQGILTMNTLAAFSTFLVITRVWRDIDWRKFRRLAPSALAAVFPGVWFASHSDTAILLVTIGAISIVMIAVSLLVIRTNIKIAGTAALIVTGAASGLSNAIAGMGGPPLTTYAILSDWPHRSFTATVQPLVFMMGVSGIFIKLFVFPMTIPTWHWSFWMAIAVTLVIGVFTGDKIAEKFTPKTLRTWVIIIALTGATIVLIRGIFMMFS